MPLHNGEPPERRSSVRLKAELRVYYGDHQSKLLTGYSIDLSTGGIFLSTTCPFDVDDIVKLKLSIPGEEESTVSCDARVAWINYEDKRLKPEFPTGVGLQFVDLTPENFGSIVGFLEVEAAW
ncbi:PilZ domain-containing protein [Deltaproteobacteria bacterium IMCC39524]|nr:PilZ domain-containing protein [Deltaproteobacteria bacterium IMCC39524]